MTVVYRYNDINNVNVPVGKLTKVSQADLQFNNVNSLDQTIVRTMLSSVEVNNPEPIVGQITNPTTNEIRNRAFGVFATQNRAVTQNDLQAITYAMPAKFGSIKMFVVSDDSEVALNTLFGNNSGS